MKEGFTATGMKVKDVAVEDPITVFPDEPIWVAIQKMSPRDLARLPVVRRGELLGLVSIGDVVKYRLAQLENESRSLRDYIAAS